MIIEELAYKITVQTKDFLLGKKKIEVESEDLKNKIDANGKAVGNRLAALTGGMKTFGQEGKNAFSTVQASAAKFLGVALTLEGARRMFLSTTQQLVQMGNTSAFLGMSTQSLDGFTKSAEAAGASGQAMGGMLMRLKSAQLWQQTGMGAPDDSTVAMLQAQGSTGVDIVGAKDPGEALLRMRQALMKMPANQSQYMAARMGVDPDMYEAMMRPDFEQNVDKYTRASNKTPEAVKQAQQVTQVLTQLRQEVENIGTSLVQTFGPDITKGLQQLDDWIKQHRGDIVGFFKELSDEAKTLSDSVGGIGSLLKIYAAYKVGGPMAAAAAAGYVVADKKIEDDKAKAAAEGKSYGQYLVDEAKKHQETDKPLFSSAGDAWDKISSWLGFGSAKADTITPSIPGVTPMPGNEVRQFSAVAPDYRSGGNYSGELSSLGPSESSDRLLNALMMTESGGNPLAYNAGSGAAGAYQFMPDTARELGLTVNGQQDDRLDPEKSRAAANIYMSQLMKHYNGNVTNALRAYNWGIGNMDSWLKSGVGVKGQSMPKETQDYPGRVAGYYSNMAQAASTTTNNSSSVDQSQTSSTHIGTVNVTTSAETVDQLTKAIDEQAKRSRVTVSFSGGVQ